MHPVAPSAPSAHSDTSDNSDYEDDQPEVDEYGNYVTPPPKADLPESDLPPPPKALPSRAIYSGMDNTSSHWGRRHNKKCRDGLLETALDEGIPPDTEAFEELARCSVTGAGFKSDARKAAQNAKEFAERAAAARERIAAKRAASSSSSATPAASVRHPQ